MVYNLGKCIQVNQVKWPSVNIAPLTLFSWFTHKILLGLTKESKKVWIIFCRTSNIARIIPLEQGQCLFFYLDGNCSKYPFQAISLLQIFLVILMSFTLYVLVNLCHFRSFLHFLTKKSVKCSILWRDTSELLDMVTPMSKWGLTVP